MAPTKRGHASSEDTFGSPVRPPRKSAVSRESPLKRLKTVMQQQAAARAAREEVVLSTVDDYRAHVELESRQPPNPDVDVIVRGTLLWKSGHVYGDRSLVRLHITDAEPEESLDALAEFEDRHGASDEGRVAVDSLLLTATVFGEHADSSILPPNGSVIRIRSSRKRIVYEGKFCQLVTRHGDITIE